MKAAVAISRANLNDLGLKDNIIDQLQREIEVLKTQLFKEVFELNWYIQAEFLLNYFPQKKEKFKLLLQKTLNLNP